MRPGAERTWLLLVAIDRYADAAHIPDLPGPAPDAEAILAWAKDHGIPPHQCRVHLARRSTARGEDGAVRPEVVDRIGWPVVEPTGPSYQERDVQPGQLPVLDARKDTIDESFAELVALEPGDDAHLHVFLLGHGVMVGNPPRRVFLTEDLSPRRSDRDLPLYETDGSVVDALSLTAFREVFVYYDACSTAEVPQKDRESIAVGHIATAIDRPRRDTAVTVCTAGGIYEAARDVEGSPFVAALLDVLGDRAGASVGYRVVEGRKVIDLEDAFTTHVVPTVRERTRGQRPELRPFNVSVNSRVIPVVCVAEHVPDYLDALFVRYSQQAKEHGANPVEVALDHVELAAALRALSSSAHALVALLRTAREPPVAASVGVVARDVRERVRALDLDAGLLLEGQQLPVREALDQRAELPCLEETVDDIEPSDVVQLLTEVVLPVRTAVEAATVHLLRAAIMDLSDEPVAAVDRGNEAFSLWAHALDSIVAATVLAPREVAAATVAEALDPVTGWSAATAHEVTIEHALLAALVRGRSGITTDEVDQLIDADGGVSPSLAALYRDWCRTAQETILSDLEGSPVPRWRS